VLEFKDNSMDHKIFQAHGIGVNSVSWAPSTSAGSLVSSTGGQTAGGQRRFVTGGSDNLVKFWAWDPASQSYKQEGEPLVGHGDWVRDVAWSPSVLQRSYVASASQDKTVRIWTSDPSNPTVWYVIFNLQHNTPFPEFQILGSADSDTTGAARSCHSRQSYGE
jgi:protein transport protein SEC13